MKPSRSANNNCPETEDLCAFAERTLPEKVMASIQEHLLSCDLCLKEVHQIKKTLSAAEGPQIGLPVELRKKALYAALGESPVRQSVKRFSEYVLTISEKGIHFLSNLILPEEARLQISWPSPLPVGAFRNGEEKGQDSVILEESMGEIKIKILLLHTSGPGVALKIFASKNEIAIPNQRISLYQEESLLGSKLTSREGSIEFPGLGFGYYSIKIPHEEIEMRFRIDPEGI
jgi:hypothetical protein